MPAKRATELILGAVRTAMLPVRLHEVPDAVETQNAESRAER
jgi:hypothetical protein